jgi:uncharacterized membrane protein YgcG
MTRSTVRRVSMLCALIVVVFSPSSYGMSMNVTAVTQLCTTQNFTKTRICDPNHYINNENIVQRQIIELETKSFENCTSTIQFGLVIIDKMQLSDIYVSNEDLHDYVVSNGKRYAKYIHDFFGVGRKDCGGTGILLFISIQDRVMYISISSGLNHILTQSRINSIIELMKPYMRVDSYEGGVIHAIQAIDKYVDNGPPGFWEAHRDFIVCFGFVIFFITAPILSDYFKRNRMRSRLKEYDDVKKKLAQFDRDRRLALMGKYECSSCPICLEDFTSHVIKLTPSSHNETEKLISKDTCRPDDIPVHILVCGHAFHESCWLEWKRKSRRYRLDRCPICREKTNEFSQSENQEHSHHFSSDEVETRNSIHDLIPYRSRQPANFDVFYRERHFRLERLSLLHPRYVRTNQINRWINDDSIPLSQDHDFMRSDPSRADFIRGSIEKREQYGGQPSFDSFGGGSSGGNGGGGTW